MSRRKERPMADFLRRLFDSDFLPHGHCYFWQPALVWLHVTSDALIALAYFWIPASLLYFARKRTDVPFQWMFVMFGAFIIACGLTHAMEVWTLWHGTYRLSGVIKAGTALISMATAVALVPLVPEALSVPSHEQLQRANEALRAQIGVRERAEQRLTLVHTVLRAVSETADFASGLRTTLASLCAATGWTVGEAWTVNADGTGLVVREAWSADDEASPFVVAGQGMTLELHEGLPGSAWQTRRAVWSEDLAEASFRRGNAAREAGLQAAFAIPVVVDAETIAVLQFFSRERQHEDEQFVTLAAAVAVELGSVMRRRHTEEALRESEGTLKSLFEYAPDAILAVNRAGRILQANLQAEAMFGYDRDELRGRSIEVLLPERLREQHRQHRRAYSAEPRRRPMGAGLRLFGLRKDGSEVPVDITLTPVENRDGVVMAVARDMTERREARRRFRRLLESAPDAMILVGPDGRVVAVNSHAERMFGYGRHEMLGQPLAELIPPRLREVAGRGLAAFFREPRMIHLGSDGAPEISGLHKDGRELPLQVTMSAIETEIGLLAVAAVRDLTEKREAERQREQLYQELRRSRERLAVLSTRLLAAQESERRTIARELHDEIGQALTAVSVNLQTLLTSPESADRTEVLDESITITQQTLRQVRNLSLDLRPSLLDDLGLGPALRWYLERQAQRLGCTISLDDNLGDLRYPAPIETTCFRVAQEAITNVARHSNAQTVRVTVRREAAELHLAVEDDGAGFDVDAARERASRGHSLGLLGMEERATLAGGRIEIISRPGHGTRVVARFPIEAAAGA
jgi:PAS domain S-box-containing protein